MIIGTTVGARLVALETVAPTDPRIAITGRTASTAAGVVMAYPAITLRFTYSGPAPTVHLTASNDDNYWNLACNGWDPVRLRLKAGENAIALPTGPAPEGGWVIELGRRTEAWMGITTFTGLTLPDGAELLPPPAAPTRKLLVLGDSSTCGEFIERFPPEDNANHPATANATRSYGMLLGKWLNAETHVVAYGGRGIMTDWAGRTDNLVAGDFFGRALPDDPAATWDHARFQPDVILTHFGLADLLTDPVDDNVYVAAWQRYLDQIRAAHPAAPIVITESSGLSEDPMIHRGQLRLQLERVLQRVVADRHAAGDSAVHYTPLSHYPGGPNDPHPLAFQHEQIALELMPAVKAAAGW